jgi:hypothetical protein
VSAFLFVDFDGVLHRRPRPHEVARHYARMFEYLEPLAVALGDFPAARIVVSSSWRLTYSADELRAFLGPLGPRMAGVTGPERETRYEEILEATGEAPWLAIEDDLRGWPEAELRHVVGCDPYQGLGEPGKLDELSEKLRAIEEGA